MAYSVTADGIGSLVRVEVAASWRPEAHPTIARGTVLAMDTRIVRVTSGQTSSASFPAESAKLTQTVTLFNTLLPVPEQDPQRKCLVGQYHGSTITLESRHWSMVLRPRGQWRDGRACLLRSRTRDPRAPGGRRPRTARHTVRPGRCR